MTHVRLTNSMSKEKQLLGVPFDHAQGERPEIKLYVCGITRYVAPHIGHGRCYVTFDVLYRLLEFLGYKVIYCRNFTDIDDKLLAKSQKEFGTPFKFAEVAQRYIDIFDRDMQLLNCKKPTFEPRVTQTIPEIIAFVQALIDAGKRVLFTRCSDIVQRLSAARRDLRLPQELQKLDRFDLLILDDISYVRRDQAETAVLFELIADRYERKSIAITANTPFSQWTEVFVDAAMTLAAIDRLVHHSTILEMNVESYRRRVAVESATSRRPLPQRMTAKKQGEATHDRTTPA